ncbi:Uncharacterised protein [Pragia fontium]|nr:Uncharacterised protein [Pragia fontium]
MARLIFAHCNSYRIDLINILLSMIMKLIKRLLQYS